MPVIRQIQAGNGLDIGSAPQVQIDNSIAEGAAAFGRGVQRVGQAQQDIELRLAQQKIKIQEFEADQAFTRLNTDLSGQFAERQVNIAPSGEGFADQIGTDFSAGYDAFLGNVPQELRPKFVELAATEKQRWLTQAAAAEVDQRNTWYRTGVADTLDQKQGEVFEVPDRYQDALTDVYRTIEASGLPPVEQEALRKAAEKSLGASVAERYIRDNPAALIDALDVAVPNDAMDLLRQSEGFRAQPYNDPRTDDNGNQVGPDIYRAGYGSDTITKADGSVVKVTPGMVVSKEDAERDLTRRTKEFERTAIGQVGPDAWAALEPQARAALTSLAYNYGSLPNRVANAVKSGNTASIVAAVTGLQDDNGGVNRKRRLHEAALISGEAGSQPAPEFAGLSFAERLELNDRAVARQADLVTEANSRARADYDAMKGSMELGIKTGEVVSEQTILNSALTDAHKADLLTTFRAAMGDHAASDQFLRDWAQGQQRGLNPYDTADRKLAEDAYTSLLKSVGPEQAPGATAQFIADTGVVPGAVVADVRQNLNGVDVASVANGLKQAAAIYQAAPQGLDSVDHGSELRDAAITYNEMVNERGLTEQQAAAEVLRMRDPAQQKSAALLDTSWKQATKDGLFRVDDVLATFDDGNAFTFGGPSAGMTPMQVEGLTADYLAAAERAYRGPAMGDVGIAKSIALAEMKRTYGVSSTSGQEVVMKYPPEQFYPPVAGSYGYLRDMAIKDAQTIEPGSGNIMLVPTVETSQDVRGGQPPRYNLMYQRPDGVWDVAPGLWGPDMAAIEALSALDSEERAIRFQMERQKPDTSFLPPGTITLPGAEDVGMAAQLADIEARRKGIAGDTPAIDPGADDPAAAAEIARMRETGAMFGIGQ